MADFKFTDQGSIWLLRATNDVAQEHLDENITDPMTWAGQIVVDHRCGPTLINQLLHDGFTVSHDGDELELAA